MIIQSQLKHNKPVELVNEYIELSVKQEHLSDKYMNIYTSRPCDKEAFKTLERLNDIEQKMANIHCDIPNPIESSDPVFWLQLLNIIIVYKISYYCKSNEIQNFPIIFNGIDEIPQDITIDQINMYIWNMLSDPCITGKNVYTCCMDNHFSILGQLLRLAYLDGNIYLGYTDNLNILNDLSAPVKNAIIKHIILDNYKHEYIEYTKNFYTLNIQ